VCLHSYTAWKIIYPSFLTTRTVGAGRPGDPFYLKFWGQTNPVGGKTSCCNIQGKHKQYSPVWLLLMAMRADFCMKFKTTVKQRNTLYHHDFKYIWKWQNYAVSLKTSRIYQRSSRVFPGILLVVLKKAGLLAMGWGCRLEDGQN